LFNITGGPDLGMYEIDEAAKAITEAAGIRFVGGKRVN
jgi:cell division GTPase FtsZ